ncbi:MAG: hypothetical protein MOB07_17965 [Acidobacteria bacterium]|nr:hypothetical protein [Acidobacteriota bacterium]
MSNLGPLEDLLRRSMDAYMRYYGAVGQLTVDYMKDLMATWSQVRIPSTPAVSFQTTTPPPAPTRSEEPSIASQPAPQSAPQSAKQSIGVMVLEGDAGGGALGVFLVENHLGREVSARVTATGFTAPDGSEVHPALVFDPEVIALQPGEQLLVRVMAAIDDSLEPDVRYQGEFTVPELTGTRIPVVLRRRVSQSTSASADRAGQSGGMQRKSSVRSRAAKPKRASSRKKD